MIRRLRTPLVLTVGIGLLAGAAYVAASLFLSPSARPALLAIPGRTVNYAAIPAPALPPAPADVLGALVEVRDPSLMLRPISKGSGSSDASLVEVLVTGSTKVYFDTTSDQSGTIVDGRIQQTVVPFPVRNISLGDTVLARAFADRGHHRG